MTSSCQLRGVSRVLNSPPGVNVASGLQAPAVPGHIMWVLLGLVATYRPLDRGEVGGGAVKGHSFMCSFSLFPQNTSWSRSVPSTACPSLTAAAPGKVTCYGIPGTSQLMPNRASIPREGRTLKTYTVDSAHYPLQGTSREFLKPPKRVRK